MLCVRAAPVDEVWGRHGDCYDGDVHNIDNNIVGDDCVNNGDINNVNSNNNDHQVEQQQRFTGRLRKPASNLTSMVFGGLTFKWYRRHSKQSRAVVIDLVQMIKLHLMSLLSENILY
ncbi:hypothetical protein O3M35_002437 [Rhynocoris fuscipes]|uniref:Uncharacterized protein n=1 Tax=Rhynocoris fuscipes TaxID=488301 RepID=A0AAW1CKC7_9HEMI